ncbi:hypothetical protein ACXVWQ_10695, partial [Haemophilus sp. SZY H57]
APSDQPEASAPAQPDSPVCDHVLISLKSFLLIHVHIFLQDPQEGSSGASKLRLAIYPDSIELAILSLMSLLQEDPLLEATFARIRYIMANLHEQVLPQALSSACALFHLDFWPDWQTYNDAINARDILEEHLKEMEDVPQCETLNEERAKAEAEISSLESEIQQLQAKLDSLRIAREEREKAILLAEENREREFILHKVSASRLAAKEGV